MVGGLHHPSCIVYDSRVSCTWTTGPAVSCARERRTNKLFQTVSAHLHQQIKVVLSKDHMLLMFAPSPGAYI